MEQAAAREELRERLDTARLRARIGKRQLAARAALSPTTVSNALNGTGPVPSKETVVALAKALGLDTGPLLELRAAAAGPPPGPVKAASPHRPTTDWGEAIPVETADPARLQVHAAVLPAPDPGGYTFLTPYLRRRHDQEIRDRLTPALQGQTSVLVMVTGGSSTGKTRALYQVLADLAPHCTLLCPDTGEDLLRLLERGRIEGQAVLWLNEAQRFFYGPHANEAAAALHRLLAQQTGTVAVGTLWTDPYWQDLTRPGTPGDPHAHIRDLLTGPVTARITVPDRLSPDEQHQWRELGRAHDDQRLSQALDAGSADRGRIVQHLSGGPELLRAYLDGPGHHFTATEHALITAAVDARRLGHRAPLPAPLLAQAADAQLDPRERPTGNHWGPALEGLCTGQRPDGTHTDIRRALTAVHTHVPRTGAEAAYEPADYLEQQLGHRRADQLGDPDLWQALLEHTTDPHSLYTLADAAERRGLLQHAVRLYQRAIRARHPTAAAGLAGLLSPETDPHQNGTRWLIEHADLTDPFGVTHLPGALCRTGQEETARVLASRAAEQADPTDPGVSAHLLGALFRTGQGHAVGVLASRAAEHADLTQPGGVGALLEVLHDVGRKETVPVLLARNPAEHTDPTDSGGVAFLLEVLHEVGREEMVGVLASRAAEHADLTQPGGVGALLEVLHRTGREETVQVLLARNPAEHTDPTKARDVASLLGALHEVGREETVGVLASRAANLTNPTDPRGVAFLLEVLHRTGREEMVGVLASRAAEHTDPTDPRGVAFLLEVLHRTGREETVGVLASRAANLTNLTDSGGVASLLEVLHEVGREEMVGVLASRAAEHADLTQPGGVAFLLEVLHRTGREETVQVLLARNPAEHTDPTKARDVASLLGALHEVGREETVQVLERRALNAGGLRPLPPPLLPYGRDLDGTPAQAWTWDELGL